MNALQMFWEEMDEDNRVALLAELEGENAQPMSSGEMDPDDAADLLREVGEERATALLELMEPEDAECFAFDDVRGLFSWWNDDNPEPIVLTADSTVADALAAVRQKEISPALASQIYICRQPVETPTGRFIGVVHYQRLLREPPSTLLGSIVDTDSKATNPDATLHEVSSHLASYNMLSLPVVDANDRLLGAVTVDDVLDHLLPENWRHDHRENSPVSFESESI
jgi:Mg/Co/Ni transporter MgtE